MTVIAKKGFDNLSRLKMLGSISDEEFQERTGRCVAESFVESAGYDFNVELGLKDAHTFVVLHLYSRKEEVSGHKFINGICERLEELGVFNPSIANSLLDKVEQAFS